MIRKFFSIFLLLAGALSAEQTLAIIKPDAVKEDHIGDILSIYEKNGLKIVGLKMIRMTPTQAGKFYEIHKDRPFYKELTQFMSSGPVVAVVLEGKYAISKNRELMGATDPHKAVQGTIRSLYGSSVGENAVHGSDSNVAAKEEIHFFFTPQEIYP